MKTFYEYFQCRRVGQGCEPAIIPAWPKNKRKPLGNCLRARLVTKNFWRRRRDSNPRDPFESNGFQDRRFQPLTHSSVFKYSVLYGLDCQSGIVRNLICKTRTRLHRGRGGPRSNGCEDSATLPESPYPQTSDGNQATCKFSREKTHDRNSDLIDMGRTHSQPTLGGIARQIEGDPFLRYRGSNGANPCEGSSGCLPPSLTRPRGSGVFLSSTPPAEGITSGTLHRRGEKCFGWDASR